MKKCIAFVLCLLMILASVSGCAGKASSESANAKESTNTTSQSSETSAAENADMNVGVSNKSLDCSGETLRIAVQSQYASYMIQYIMDQGWAEEEGIPLEVNVFPGGPAINEAIAANSVDIAITGGAFIYACANYDSYLVAYQIDGSGNNCVMARLDNPVFNTKGYNADYPEVYGTPEDIKGAVLLQNSGTTSQYIMSAWLGVMGLTYDDVEALSLDTAQIVTSFKAGEGDYASFTQSSEVLAAEENGFGVVASLNSMNYPLYEATVASKDAYNNRYGDVVKFVELLYRANDELSASESLQYDTICKWYTENGKEVNEVSFRDYISSRPLVTSAQAKDIDLTNFVSLYAKFYIDCELIEADRYDVIMNNVGTDVFADALNNLSK